MFATSEAATTVLAVYQLTPDNWSLQLC